MPPPITLRSFTADTLPALQALYDASTGYFYSHGGGPARPEQAAFAYQHVLESGDRVLLGVWWEREMVIGCFDLRFDHTDVTVRPHPGVVWFGAFILRDELPADREEIETWALRILEEWLRIGTEMREMRLALLVSDHDRVRFWTKMGYQATPTAYRQVIAGGIERFVIYRKPILNSLAEMR